MIFLKKLLLALSIIVIISVVGCIENKNGASLKNKELELGEVVKLMKDGKVTAISQSYKDKFNDTIAWVQINGELYKVKEQKNGALIEEKRKCGKPCDNISAMKVDSH